MSVIKKICRKILCHLKCPCCGRWGWYRKRRTNGQYVDESRNWVVLCDECFGSLIDYFKERFAEYYNSCL